MKTETVQKKLWPFQHEMHSANTFYGTNVFYGTNAFYGTSTSVPTLCSVPPNGRFVFVVVDNSLLGFFALFSPASSTFHTLSLPVLVVDTLSPVY